MIYDFTTTNTPDVSEVGGKGFSLMRMTQVGLPVPSGFNLAVEFFEPWISELRNKPEWEAVQKILRDSGSGGDLSSNTDSLKAACKDLKLTSD